MVGQHAFPGHSDLNIYIFSLVIMGRYDMVDFLKKQKINIYISIQTELVGVYDTVTIILKAYMFIKEHGFKMKITLLN